MSPQGVVIDVVKIQDILYIFLESRPVIVEIDRLSFLIHLVLEEVFHESVRNIQIGSLLLNLRELIEAKFFFLLASNYEGNVHLRCCVIILGLVVLLNNMNIN